MSKRLSVEFLAEWLQKYFVARTDVYGREAPDGWITVKEKLTKTQIVEHLSGKYCLGVYPFTEKGLVKWIVLDVDRKRGKMAFKIARETFDERSVLLEDTGGRGMHVWILLQLTPLWQLRSLVNSLRSVVACEVFPKQLEWRETVIGNFCRLPLGIHQKAMRKSEFVDGPRPTFLEIEPYITCRHRIFDQFGDPNCVYHNSSVGRCKEDLCPVD